MNFLNSRKNYLFFILVTYFTNGFCQEFSMTHNLPVSARAEEVFTAEFTVKKGSIGSFAKFQCDLPVGFTAVASDVKGGSFTFENQRAKIVWVSVPAEANFSFSLKLTPPKNALNECILSPKFYYLENNAKKEFETSPHHIRMENNSSENNSSSQTPITSGNEVVVSDRSVGNSVNASTSSPKEEVNSSSEKSENADVTADNSSDKQRSVATETKKSETNSSSSPRESTKSNSGATNSLSTSTTSSESSVNESSRTNTTSTTSTSSNTVSSKTEKSSTLNSTSGLIYKVQLGAFSVRPAKSKFPGIDCSIAEEDGLFKVTTGNFTSKDQAEKLKLSLSGKGYSCYIVTYQNGIRVKK